MHQKVPTWGDSNIYSNIFGSPAIQWARESSMLCYITLFYQWCLPALSQTSRGRVSTLFFWVYSCSYSHLRWTDEKFTPVKEAYQLNFEESLEVGSQLTMYYKGNKVVDLWGTIPELAPTYSNHSLQRVFSSGKMVEVLAAVICVDKGLFSLDDPIAKYWPGFHSFSLLPISSLITTRDGKGLSLDIPWEFLFFWFLSFISSLHLLLFTP